MATKFFEVTFRAEVNEDDAKILKSLEGKNTKGFVPFEPLKNGARLWHFTVDELDRKRYVPEGH